jgi:hypothetical protein
MDVRLLNNYLQSKDFEMKLDRRLERLQRAEANPVERMNVMADCREDIFVFLDLFANVYEPRNPAQPDIPMFLFPHQRALIYKLMEAESQQHDELIDKTRDMMATWTVLWYMLYKWLFQNQWYGLVGSRKEEEVDDRTPQSLFGKLRYGLYMLPAWMRPEGFRKSDNDNHMKLINPASQSFIDGESANPNFARGSRSSFIFMDELFFWRFARESWRACMDSSPCRIAVSTPIPSSFARTLHDSMELQGHLFTLDGRTMHPFKDAAWFKAEELRRAADPLGMAGEINLSYQSDPTLAYYPEVNNCPLRDFDYNPDMPLYVSLDFGVQDKTAVEYWQRDTKFTYMLDAMEQNQRPLGWYLPFLIHGYDFKNADQYEIENKFTKEKILIKKNTYSAGQLELIARFNSWKMPVMYAGELAHTNRTIDKNMSIKTILAGYGIFIRVNTLGNSHSSRRNAVRKMLPQTIFSSKYGALDVFDALANSQFVPGRENSGSEEGKDKPVHNEYADLRAAVENFSVNVMSAGQGVRVSTYARNRFTR